jgi:hypothetical protein
VIGSESEIDIVDLEDGDVIIAASDGLIEIWDNKKNSLGPGRDENEICEDVTDFIN